MAVDVTDAVIGSAESSLVVIDSIAALAPMKEVEASAEDNFVGLQARLVGGMIRKVTSALIRERKRGHYVTVLFINQFRTKIGVMYGDPRTVPGGKALEYSTTVQITMKNKEQSGKDARDVEAVTHNEHAFTITKNKMNHGPRTGEFKLIRVPDEEYGLEPGDVDDAHTLLAYAKKFGAYGGGGSKWTLEFDQHKHVFGKAREAIVAMYEDRNLYWALRNWIIREQARFLAMPDDFLEIFEV
jgi:recombination protein RecA